MLQQKTGIFVFLTVLLTIPLVIAQSDDNPNKIENDVIFMTTPPPGAGLALSEFDINVVKGAPYSASAQSETIQTLPDGNRIVQRNSTQVYRDSEGRSRQEYGLGLPDPAAGEGIRIISITDPVSGFSYTLHPEIKAAEKVRLLDPGSGTFNISVPPPGGVATARTNVFFRRGVVAENGPATAAPLERGIRIFVQGPNNLNPQRVSESLGKQVMEGVEVDGKRTTATIPAGQIGNEKPIIITTESWYSPELQTVVYSKRSDPMAGTTTYRLTKLTRGEPDAALFQVPSDYTINEPEVKVLRKVQPLEYQKKK